ncbi:MAG: helix-turn-helix transcriptional regulator [Clostridia bacterium]|nr:helix-turn-helix transcriptional regulator [Clostridia bacterium]
MKYQSKNISADITLDFLAEKFFINKYYMCHTFKKQTGITIKEFMNTRKITKAKQMLSEGADIMGLCYECGFNDYSTFYKAFKKLTGKSPKDFLTGD